MRRILFTSLFTLALIIGAAGAAPAAYAQQESCSNIGQTCYTAFGAQGVCVSSPEGDAGYCEVGASSPAPYDPVAAKTPVEPPKNPDNSEGFNQVMIWIMMLFAWLVGVATVILDNAVYYTVVTMGQYINQLKAIGFTWRILRDIGNIVLIFGFLVAGIATIINVNIYGWGSKMLPKLLVAAVFLNFSLFITEAVIDAGNLFATQFYTQINGGTITGPKNWDAVSTSNDGIASKIMSQVGLQTIHGQVLNTGRATDLFKNSWVIGFMAILLFLITAFVLFSLAFILIARFVYLVFLIILAPIGFAGLAVPKLEGIAGKWWSKLFEQTITAPILLLLLYIALAVITDAQFLAGLGSNQSYTGFVDGNLTGFASMMLSFLIAMGLLLAVVIAAKNMSAFGAGWATKTAGKVTFGLTAWGATRTAGRLASYTGRGLRQSKTFNKFDAFTGRATTRALDKVATGSFDIRGTGLLKKLPGGGIDAGEAAKEGFAGAQKRNIEQHEKATKAIEQAYKDSGDTRSEQKNVVAATKAYEEAQIEKLRHEERKNAVQAQQARAKAEADRLAAIDLADRNAGRASTVGDALREAQRTLAENDRKLSEAVQQLNDASRVLADAERAKAQAEKAPSERRTEGAKESKRAYAEAISRPINIINPFNVVGYGPGDSMAARKIKESLKEKGNKDKIFDAVMAEQKRIQTEEEGAGKGAKPEEAQKSGEAGAGGAEKKPEEGTKP